MDDLDRFARTACRRAFASVGDVDTRYEVAWSGIAEALCGAEEAPWPEQLIRAGWLAIDHEMKQVGHLYGVAGPGMTLRRRYVYWVRREDTGHDLGVVEKVAVQQILPMLTEAQRDAVVALAVHNNYREAAAALGLKDSAFTMRLSKARVAFLAQWFAPETAPKVRRMDRRVTSYSTPPRTECLAGHELVGENLYLHPVRGRRCRQCAHDQYVARRNAKGGAA
jgi:hypothetical protein